jgi:hypothetical protein
LIHRAHAVCFCTLVTILDPQNIFIKGNFSQVFNTSTEKLS